MIGLGIALIALTAALYYGTRNFAYWKKKGVKYEMPMPFFGNYFKGTLFMKTFSQYAFDYYKKYSNENVSKF